MRQGLPQGSNFGDRECVCLLDCFLSTLVFFTFGDLFKFVTFPMALVDIHIYEIFFNVSYRYAFVGFHGSRLIEVSHQQ